MGDDVFKVSIVEDKPLKGQWHCGNNACWVTVEHTPTKMSVTAYHRRQYKAFRIAKELLEYMLLEAGETTCRFPEAFEYHTARKPNRFLETFAMLEKKGKNQ